MYVSIHLCKQRKNSTNKFWLGRACIFNVSFKYAYLLLLVNVCLLLSISCFLRTDSHCWLVYLFKGFKEKSRLYISISYCIITKKVSLHVNDTDKPEQFCYNLFCHHTYSNFHYILRTLPWLLIPHYNMRTVNIFHVSKRYCLFLLDLTLGVISLMHT